MGMTEKESLINALVIELNEKFDIKVKESKYLVSTILQGYHVTISDESFRGEDLSTEYLFKKFHDAKLAAGMSETTLKQYDIAVRLLEKTINKRLSDIEPDDLTYFLREYKTQVSSVTLRAKYQLLSSVYNWLYARKYIPSNPIIAIDAPKSDMVIKKPLSEYDLEKIKRTCENFGEKESLRNMALIYFFISTGCRVSEVRNTKIGDVDFEKKNCKVMGKGRKERFVVLSDKAIYRLKLYIDNRKETDPECPLFASIRGKEHSMTTEGIEKVINKIRELSKVEKLTCHVFRRFYATELRRRNVNIQMIATSLGHANLNQINRYSLYNSSEMQNAIRNAM